MFEFVPLQTATGGSPVIVAITLITLFVTVLLSLIVAYLVIRGYQRNQDRARLYLALGLVLLTATPIVLQFVFTNVGVSPGIRSAAANTSKLVGLAAMLYAIYGVTYTQRDCVSNSEGGTGRDPRHSDKGNS